MTSKKQAVTAYFISGLGADRRIFKNLHLPADVSIVYLDWLEPQNNEPFLAYCQRLAAGIDRSEDFVLVGLSFGGMVAAELCDMVKPKHTIIISSAGSKRELPWYFRLAGALRLYAFVSPYLLKIPNPFTFWILGASAAEERLLIRQFLKETTPAFLKWSVKTILTWKRSEKPAGIYHIHGNADRILPVRYTHPDFIISKGGHMMVYNMPEKISKLLMEKLGLS